MPSATRAIVKTTDGTGLGSTLRVGPGGVDSMEMSQTIRSRLRSSDQVNLIIVGPGALGSVVRAILRVEDELAVTRRRDGIGSTLERLTMVPTILESKGDNEPQELHLLIQTTRSLPGVPDGELVAARSSNVGKIGGAIAQRLRGDSRSIAVRCAGAVALRQALRATAVASRYLSETGDLIEGCQLAALARMGDLQQQGLDLPSEWVITVFVMKS